MADNLVYGPHCNHAELCSMDGCDQRGHIDYPCKNQATCSYCHPSKACPMDCSVSVADCSECRVKRDDVDTVEPIGGQSVVPAGLVEHDKGCLPRDRCVECGGCDCGADERVCEVPGCNSVEDHDQWVVENGYEECSYGCH